MKILLFRAIFGVFSAGNVAFFPKKKNARQSTYLEAAVTIIAGLTFKLFFFFKRYDRNRHIGNIGCVCVLAPDEPYHTNNTQDFGLVRFSTRVH